MDAYRHPWEEPGLVCSLTEYALNVHDIQFTKCNASLDHFFSLFGLLLSGVCVYLCIVPVYGRPTMKITWGIFYHVRFHSYFCVPRFKREVYMYRFCDLEHWFK